MSTTEIFARAIALRLMWVARQYPYLVDSRRLDKWITTRAMRMLYHLDEDAPDLVGVWIEGYVHETAEIEAMPPEVSGWLKLLWGTFANARFRDGSQYDQRLYTLLCLVTYDELELLAGDLGLRVLAQR